MCEGEPHPLWDLARVRHPRPELDVSCVCRLDEVGDDALERALVADDPLDDLRCPGMGRDIIQAEVHPVEDVEAEGVRQATPGAEVDVDASSCEVSLAASLRRMGSVLEADQVGLQLVELDGDLSSLQLELSSEEVRDVACTGVARQMERPQDEGAGFPVPRIVLEVEQVGDEHCLHIRARVGIPYRHWCRSRRRSWWWWWRRWWQWRWWWWRRRRQWRR